MVKNFVASDIHIDCFRIYALLIQMTAGKIVRLGLLAGLVCEIMIFTSQNLIILCDEFVHVCFS